MVDTKEHENKKDGNKKNYIKLIEIIILTEIRILDCRILQSPNSKVFKHGQFDTS